MRKSSIQVALVLCAVLGVCSVGRAQRGGTPAPQGPDVRTALPPDVYPDSRARLPLPKREQMDAEGQQIYDRFVGPEVKSLAGLQGPYGVWLHNPKLAALAQPLNAYLRYDTPLGPRLTELGILVAARELNNQFLWTSHEPNAIKEGLDPATIEVVRGRKATTGLPDREAVIITLGRELYAHRKPSAALFAHARGVLGDVDLVNLVALFGDYAAMVMVSDAFDIQLRPGQTPLLPLR